MDKKREKILKKLDELSQITLSEDPVESGLGDMTDKIAKVTNNRMLVTRLANYIIKMLGESTRNLKTAKSILKVKINGLLSTSEYVKKGGSRDERLAIAEQLADEEQKVVNQCEHEMLEWSDLNVCANNCLAALKSAKESLSRQLSVVEHQIELGEVDGQTFATR